MKIVLAPDSFKGNLSAPQVATAFERGIKRVLPRAQCIKVPMADGGEGTVAALVAATNGRLLRKKVSDPLARPVTARYGLLADNNTAVIEMAQASGLPLLTAPERNPLKTTTYGTGELILAAAKKGVNKIIIGIGGSATNDAGVGMAQALGIRFFDKTGGEITTKGNGSMLADIAAVDFDQLHPLIKKTELVIASDVNNLLYGKTGAAYVFAPQKGATQSMVKTLDNNLKHFSNVIKKQCGIDIAKLKGGGAGGGISAGLVVFTQAKIKSGVDIVLQASNIEQHLKKADLVITGEGQVDFQTAFGKAPSGVAKLAKRHGVQTIVIGGALTDDAHGVFDHHIAGLESAYARNMELSVAMANAKTYLANAAERAIRLVLIGKKLNGRHR